jgi:anti-anti-sigma regulatory factor
MTGDQGPPGGAQDPSPAWAFRVCPPPLGTIVVIGGRITPAGVPELCERARELCEGGDTDVVVCDVAALVDPDAASVDALARLQLTLRRLGCRIVLWRVADALRNLVALMGLAEVLPPLGSLSGLQARRQAEEGEQALGVEEEADAGDPAT